MNSSASVNSDQLPVACTLGPDDGASRIRRWQALAAVAHPTTSRNGPRLEVRFEDGPGVRAELEALAGAEQECCSFATWTVTEDDGHPVLHVLVEPDSSDEVAALFGA